MEPSVQDEELISRVQAGDKRAFEELVSRHQPKIISLSFRILGDQDLARELAADVFAEAFQSIKKFRRKAKFGTWLYQIALNLGHKRLRQMIRDRSLFVSMDEFSAEPDSSHVGAIHELPLQQEAAPLDQVESEKTRLLTRYVLAHLSKDHAQILMLHDIEGLSYEEVSESLNCPPGTVMSRLSRAREVFRKKWNEIVGMG